MKTPFVPLVLFLLVASIAFFALPVYSYVASSTSYRIDSDTISLGGLLSTSTNYLLQSSLSQISSETGTSTSYSVKSGYLQMSEAYLAVSSPGNVSMGSTIYTSGGGTSNGSASWTVTTDSSGGYSLSIKASTAPALQSTTDSFGNYQTQVSGIPDYDFSDGAAADFFGFSPEGADIRSLYKDDGVSLCNTGSSDTSNKCWDSITTSNKVFASAAVANHPNGTNTTVKFRVGVGSLVHKKAGDYSATITVTALAL